MLKKLAGKKIVIYGTGHVARKFYKALKFHGMQGQIVCFTRTGDVCEGETFEGIPVHCFKEICIEDDTLICLAVHEAIRNDIEEIVRQKSRQYIWIYPYLYSFMLGEPERINVKLSVRKLLEGYSGDLRLGVRLAAIEQHEGLNSYGFEYYIRAQITHCDKDTAKQRLVQFSNLITGWMQSGYDKSCLIGINRNYEVIDGDHRLAMAVYTGQEAIYGSVYPTGLSKEEIHGYAPALYKDFLLQNGFLADEAEKLEKLQERYVKEYERNQSERAGSSGQHHSPCL